MLTELRVRDLGVITDLTVHFGPGMTALTGETGAGKTLLVEAVALVLGGRATPALVRAGAEQALVEARFEPSGGTGEPEVLLARSVPAAGRSRAWIDGRMASVAALGEAARGLVDIHGQHDQQSLLAAAAQRQALDGYAGVDHGPRRAARDRLAAIDRRLEALGGDDAERERTADLLRYQVEEIDRAAIVDPGEEESLVAEEERLADLSAHRQAALAAADLLDGADGVDGSGGGAGAGQEAALALLGRAAAGLAGRPGFDQWHQRLRSALSEVGDVASDLRRAVETWEDDPGRLAQVQARRHLLGELRRKYGDTLAQVRAFGADAARRLEELEGAAAQVARLQDERREALEELAAAEGELGRARREAAPVLAGLAGARMAELAMPGARLEIEVEGPAGDQVRFLLGANPGEPVQPLAQVASGGELARAMLALRLVATGGPETMIFDEVDAGVGGAAALSLARALREVAADRQVLVVTHLAQVAAHADRQVAVRKGVRDGRTSTDVAHLGDDERAVELSRMLSGHPDSTTARAHALELLDSARALPVSTTEADRID